jgi:plasmid stabilization system protein ParE
LKKKIELTVENPKMYRASIYYENEKYRDLIHQGYTTIYKIDDESRSINILEIFKWIDR